VFANNTVHDSSLFGFQVDGISGGVFANNTVYSTAYAFYITSSQYNTLFNNTLSNNTNSGFYASSVSYSNFTNNLAYYNVQDCFDLLSSENNSLSGNTVYNSSTAFSLSSSNANILANNTVYNTTSAFYLVSSSNNSLSDNLAYNNALVVFWLPFSSEGNNMTGNVIYKTPFGFAIQSGSNGNLMSNNSVNGSNAYGFQLYSVSNNVVSNNTAYGGAYGLYLDVGSSGNTITNNTAYNNTNSQIMVSNSSGNLIFNNVFMASEGQSVATDSGTNYWNTTRTCVKNIIGGDCTGGNYYSDYAGYMYDGSGIGATVYIAGSSTDYAPLTNNVGYEPSVADVSLSATSPENLSTDNLTCNYELAGTVTHTAVSWFRDSEPLMALYLPFDGVNNTLRDYSGYGNNATVVSAPVWNPSGGPDGTSAYVFNGINDYVSVPDAPSLGITENITMIAKVMRNDRLNDNYTQVLSKNGAYVMFISDNMSRVYCGNSTSWVRTREMPIIPNRYQTIACVINGSSIRIFIDSGGLPSSPSVPIYSIGDSITAQHGMAWHAGSGSNDWGFDGGNVDSLKYTYEYWLDHYAGTYVSSESINKTPLVMGGYEPFHYNKGWSGAICSDFLGPTARFPQSYDIYGTEVPNGSSVISMCGVNNLGGGQSAAQVESELQQLYERSVNKTDHMIMMTITPFNPNPTVCQNIKDVNAWLKDFTSENNITLVDTWTPLVAADYCSFNPVYTGDTLHPNIAGSRVIALAIWNAAFGNQSWKNVPVEQETENVNGWAGLDASNQDPLYIGAMPDASYPLNASVSEVRIYPRALSAEEIAQIFSSSNVMVSQELQEGETWQCRVTPLSAAITGETVDSNTLTIEPS
jgi:parallel beta-helix repeat protein